ncbi:inactive dipeptidyl peptidase 10-like isoform X2 [Patiria miniata]|uniref:Uncharacterized protein n=1 Tax=Patiria miniata TaxID=46514 RepID=A0A914B9B0_PATMI|nr:inactive dipeptidyl peptidase 10-like isoform X2 [Patiria miniata]
MVQLFSKCWLRVRTSLRRLACSHHQPCCIDANVMFSLKKSPSEELVGGGSDNRNWRGIAISLVVILLIVSLIVIAVFIVMPDWHLPKEFLFDDIFNETFKPKHYDVQWLSGSKYVHKDNYNNIIWKDLQLDQSGVLLTNRTLDEEGGTKFWVNSDMTHILLACSVRDLYRHSFYAKYKLYNIETGSSVGLTAPGLKETVDLRYAAWVPGGSALIYVYKNDMYYLESIPHGDEKVPVGDTAVRITETGEEGTIFNGIPDWVYEEELLSRDNAIYWSSDGTKLVYASFNDTDVDKARYPKYENLRYSELEEFSYPKAGYQNPTVSLQVTSIADLGNQVTLVPPDTISKRDYYYHHVVWVNDDLIAVTWLNRPQNYSVLTLCRVDSGACQINYEYETPGGWIVDRGAPKFSEGSSPIDYVRILPQREVAHGNFYHVALVTTDESPGRVTFLTQGTWEVTSIVAYSQSDKLVYYISTEQSIRSRELYSVSTERPFTRRCLSCDLHVNCTYYDTSFSPDNSWYKLNCLGPGIPRTTLHQTSTDRVLVVETNEALTKALEGKAYPNKTFYEIQVGEYKLPIQMWIPPKMDLNRKHPILVHVYGGPGSQMVNDRFELGWNAYLSSKYFVIVVNIDGRGSGFQGEKHLYQIYKRFGTVEVQDQVIGVRHILKMFPYINSTKVGIWGWSYGGFAASMALSSENDIFKYGIAVAPVTDFRYYDSIYTERYMGLPESCDNMEGYKHTNVSARARNIKGFNFLLVHGTADDNVHFQNSADFVRSLVQEEVVLRTQFYPDQRHSLDDSHVQRHLYDIMSDFVNNSIQRKYLNTELHV